MAVAVTQHKNLVGGQWVDAVEGDTMEVLNPSTGEVIARGAARHRGRRRAGRRCREDGVGRLARQDAEGPHGAAARRSRT